jgi:enoyl-CoA hydratase/carnithine racemase
MVTATNSTEPPPVLLTEREGPIMIARLNRPERMNALSEELSQALDEAWLDFREDPELKVLILTGVGDRAFCAGADLRQNDERARTLGADSGGALIADDNRTLTSPDFRGKNIGLFKPVIAAINGWCLAGGCEMAMGCDLRIIESHARMGLPEVKRGMGAKCTTHKLHFLTNLSTGLDLDWTGNPVDAERAVEIGLANEVVPTGKSVERALEIARAMCERGARYMEYHEERIFQGLGTPIEYALAMDERYPPHLEEGYREGLERSLGSSLPGWDVQ